MLCVELWHPLKFRLTICYSDEPRETVWYDLSLAGPVWPTFIYIYIAFINAPAISAMSTSPSYSISPETQLCFQGFRRVFLYSSFPSVKIFHCWLWRNVTQVFSLHCNLLGAHLRQHRHSLLTE